MENTPPKIQSNYSLKEPLILLLLSVILSAVFYIALLLYSNASNERSSKIYEQSLVASINQYEYLPALLATDPLLKETILNPNKDHLQASRHLNFIAKRAGANAVYIMNASGRVMATSNYNSDNSFLYQNYSFRPYFKDSIVERTRQFYYAKGATTGIPGFFISVPIISVGEPIGAVVVKLNMNFWEENWKNSGENIVAADENNIVILSSKPEWRYQSIGELSLTTAEKIKTQQQFIGTKHKNIYSKHFEFDMLSQTKNTFWLVGNKIYLINKFSIPEVDWTLYYLVRHDNIVLSTLIFFIILSALSLSFFLIRKERRHKLESLQATQALEIKRKEELQTVMDNIHFGITIFSETGELLSVNEHAKHLLFNGKLPDSDESIYIDQIVDINYENLDKLLLKDISAPAYHEAYSLTNGEPDIPVMFAIGKVVAMDRPIYLMTIINIRRRKDAEYELVKINSSLEETIDSRTKELHKTQAKLIQKNKAVALGNMAATIVHELSQPLAAMNSSIAAIQAKASNKDWQGAGESVQRLSPLSNKMHNVIKLLKYFSYQDSDSGSIVNLVDVVEKSLDAFKDTLSEKTIELSFNASNEVISVKANPLKLDLVLSNIIKNAIDALEKFSQAKITITVEQQESEAHIIILDNGNGVDEKIMEKMFNPYFTTKEVGKGLGLGLSITYEIIQEYGGHIEVNNKQDGACFTISLPIFEKGVQAITKNNSTSNDQSVKNQTNTNKKIIGHG